MRRLNIMRGNTFWSSSVLFSQKEKARARSYTRTKRCTAMMQYRITSNAEKGIRDRKNVNLRVHFDLVARFVAFLPPGHALWPGIGGAYTLRKRVWN